MVWKKNLLIILERSDVSKWSALRLFLHARFHQHLQNAVDTTISIQSYGIHGLSSKYFLPTSVCMPSTRFLKERRKAWTNGTTNIVPSTTKWHSICNLSRTWYVPHYIEHVKMLEHPGAVTRWAISSSLVGQPRRLPKFNQSIVNLVFKECELARPCLVASEIQQIADNRCKYANKAIWNDMSLAGAKIVAVCWSICLAVPAYRCFLRSRILHHKPSTSCIVSHP